MKKTTTGENRIYFNGKSKKTITGFSVPKRKQVFFTLKEPMDLHILTEGKLKISCRKNKKEIIISTNL